MDIILKQRETVPFGDLAAGETFLTSNRNAYIKIVREYRFKDDFEPDVFSVSLENGECYLFPDDYTVTPVKFRCVEVEDEC